MKKKGFTLIELLAVIIILAVIAVIAVPTITNIVEKASKSSFEDSAYGIIKTGEMYYSNQLLSGGEITNKSFTFPNNIEGLEIKGSKPTGGTIKVSKNGKVFIQITNGKYCVRKNYGESEVRIDEDIESCLKEVSYKDDVLNGADPEIGEGMIPVIISNNGDVTVADIYNEESPWYDYEHQKWANVVTVTSASRNSYFNNDGTYKSGTTILEGDILTYLVWIPRYKYELWNVDNTANIGIDINQRHSIKIKFQSTNLSEKENGTCSGKYNEPHNGCYYTHPAFTFGNEELNGIWVGKFETGYEGATSTGTAQVNPTGENINSSKLIIKPNVYSWRDISVAKAFTVVQDMSKAGNKFGLKTTSDAHMMKNTEWGAVAYLSHSRYGINQQIRINNNSGYKTGCGATEEDAGSTSTCTNTYGAGEVYPQSTTGNISGIFDMSGGAWEYVMGVLLDSTNTIPLSGRNNKYNSGFNGPLGCPTCNANDETNPNDSSITAITGKIDFPTSKYYDAYAYNIGIQILNRRILGDATGEMGPFNVNESYASSWYNDYAYFVSSPNPWFLRGGRTDNGVLAGTFSFNVTSLAGGADVSYSFRVVVLDK